MRTQIILFMCFLGFMNTSIAQNINPKKQDRIDLLDQVFQLLEEHAANPNWLTSESLESFKKLMYADETLNLDENTFVALFKKHRHDLDFSHFDLYSKRYTQSLSHTDTKEKTASIYWKKASEKTAYLRVITFIVDAAPMVKAVSEIGTDQFENLIIDLRGNGGGSLAAAVVLGRFLTQAPIDAGIYLTKSWFSKHSHYATTEDISKMPFLQDFTFQGISKMYAESDAFRMVLPPHQNPIFKGKVFVLMNNSTASTCEPLIDLFKKHKIATLVGKTSAGNMLSGQTFTIDDNYSVFIPIADYQTADGNRIDQVGVTPHYEIDPNEAFSFVMNQLIKNQ